MEKVTAQCFIKRLIIILVLAATFSSFTLWLIESWIKYPLLLLEILILIVLYLTVNGYDVKLTMKYIRIQDVHLSLTIDVFLIVSALILLIVHTLRIQGGLIQLILALLCTSLLSGYALANVFGIDEYFSKLEKALFSYILSYLSTGFITLAFLPAKVGMESVLVIYIVLGLFSALKHVKLRKYSSINSFSQKIDLLSLITITTFCLIAFSIIYPEFALLTNTDMFRHYKWSIASGIIIRRTPELYIGPSPYLLHHIHEYAFIFQSNTLLIHVQMALVTLNLMLPIAFYVMVKPYTEKIDARLPSLATIFWVLFTNSFGGFAWLYFAKLKLSTTAQPQVQLLATTARKTYNGTIYGILGLWYVPATVSLVILMAMIFLMSKKEIPRSKYLVLFSIMMVALYFTHVTEAVVFALFLAVYGAISKNDGLRIGDSIKSSIIGFLLITLVYYILSLFLMRFIIDAPLLISLFCSLSVLLISLLFRRLLRPRLSSFGITVGTGSKSFLKTLVLLLLFAYAVAFLSWTSLTESFDTWQVDTIGLVPWFMYPLMLGINGLLAILSLYYITQNTKSYTTLTPFIAFMIFSFVAGKLVSTINLYFFDAGYSEKRFIWFIKLSLAALAPIPVLISIDRLKKKNISINAKTAASTAIIGTIVLYGISTTFLNLEYWNIAANNSARQPSSDEIDAINTFKEILDNDPKAWLVTITDTSASMATLAGPADMLVLKQLLYTAYGPEMAFTQLYRHPAYAQPYLYLHSRDIEYLKKFNDRFLAQYLTMLPQIFNNSEVTIYNASKPSFPQENSDVALILPYDMFLTQHELLASYHILSHGFYNYTAAYDLDGRILNSPIIVLGFDPPKGNLISREFFDDFTSGLESWSVLKGVWETEKNYLIGGDPAKYTEGMILTPLKAQNLTANSTVKPDKGDPNVLNYASLVYSYRDDKHYRLAEVFFNTDGYIYVYFRVVEGTDWAHGTPIPNWPGVNTGIKWNFGDEFDIKVVVQGDLNQLCVNGEEILTVNITNVEGQVGLFYCRFNSVAFDNFKVVGSKQLHLRPFDDYVNYLNEGGTVVILNTNGYYSFADSLFQIDNETRTCNLIRGVKSEIPLPIGIDIQPLSLKSDNISTLSHYVTTTGDVPYILEKDIGEGKLVYVNLYPLVKALNTPTTARSLYSVLGNLIDEINLPKFDPETKMTTDGYTREILLEKDAHITTESLLFPLELNLEKVNVTTEAGILEFENVTQIYIENQSLLHFEAEKCTIKTGSGLYTIIELNSTFRITSSNEDIILKMETSDEELTLSHVSELKVNSGTNIIQISARTPDIEATEATFHQLFSFGNLHWKTMAYGQNLKASGSVSFHIPISDTFSMLRDVNIAGKYQLDPPIVEYDGASTIPLAVFWTLLLLPVFLFIPLFMGSQAIKKKKESAVNEC